jgi:hypothetical protein
MCKTDKNYFADILKYSCKRIFMIGFLHNPLYNLQPVEFREKRISIFFHI